MRRRDVLHPAAVADLAALDAALAGAAGGDPQLVGLVDGVRAAAPRPTPAFRARLDERVAAGFAPEGPGAARTAPTAGRRRRRPAWRVALAPVAALLAALLVAGGLGLRARSGGGGADAPSSALSRSGSGGGGEGATGAAGAGAATPAAPPVAGDALAPGRRVERSTRLELGTTSGRFGSVTDGVVRATQRAGGFVASSQLHQGGGAGSATFVLRVPAGRLGAAVADLSRLAHVRSIEQATEDLTGAVDRTTSGLRDARIEHRALVAALATATGDDAVRLRERLARADARAARLDRARATLLRRVRYATVDLSVTASGRRGAAAAPGGPWTPGDAWHDARRVLEVVAGVAIVAVAVALPWVLLGAAAVAAARTLRRRRREAALGG